MSRPDSEKCDLRRTDVATLPYAERQLIVVADDAVTEAERHAKQKYAAENKAATWYGIATSLITNPALALSYVATEALKARNRLRDQGVKVLTVSRSEARSLFFAPGHPRDGVLYIGHPAIPAVYYTTAQFHRLTFEHKFCEALRLLMSLGATSVVVEHVAGWSREFAIKLDVPLQTAFDLGDAESFRKAGNQAHILYAASLDGTGSPGLPEDLIWYHHEPTWQALAESRLKYNCREFSLMVGYEDDFGVNAGLKLSAMNSGLVLSGRFEDHHATVWRIYGEFKKPKGSEIPGREIIEAVAR